MLDKTEQSDPPNPNEKPENCYCSALAKGSGPCLPCFTRWLAGGAREQSGLALPSYAAVSLVQIQILSPVNRGARRIGPAVPFAGGEAS